MSVNCWKVVVEIWKFGEMNHTKNMIVIDNLFITCCFLIVALTKCKSLSLVLLFYVVSVIPILYCSYWHCMFVSDTMHSTYTSLFFLPMTMDLISLNNTFTWLLIWSLALIHPYSAVHNSIPTHSIYKGSTGLVSSCYFLSVFSPNN